MTEYKKVLVDFATKCRFTKFNDCHIVCGNTTFLAHRHMLCRIDYFDTYFDGKYKVNHMDNIPYCTFDGEYVSVINTFLNLLYFGHIIYEKEKENIKLLQLFDFVNYIDGISTIVNLYETFNFETQLHIIEYIKDKESILPNVNFVSIYKHFVHTSTTNDSLDLLDHVNSNYIHLDDKEMLSNKINIVHEIQYVKLIEYMYDREGDRILADVCISKICQKKVKKCIPDDVEEYILNMKSTSGVRNYLLIHNFKYIYDKCLSGSATNFMKSILNKV